MLTREWITQKIEEFRRAEIEHLGLANANHGALEAYTALLAEFDKSPDNSKQDIVTLEAE